VAPLADAWVWPWWLTRQLDVASPAFVPGGLAPAGNVTGRNRTAIGNHRSESRRGGKER
jgi:hypothetical protein